MTSKTVTLYAITNSLRAGPELAAVPCKETPMRYTAIGSAPLAWRFRQSLDKGDSRVHFTPRSAWAAFEKAERNHVTLTREELAHAERALTVAVSALAALPRDKE